MAIYATNTAVSSEKSRAEIERTLLRYGASGFMYGWQDKCAVIMFKMHSKTVKFLLPLPDKKDNCFWKTPGGRRKRSEADAYKAWEQLCRQKWRALALAVKAKLEAVESNIALFENEFLSYLVLPDGKTVGETVIPQIDSALSGSKLLLQFNNDAIDVEAT